MADFALFMIICLLVLVVVYLHNIQNEIAAVKRGIFSLERPPGVQGLSTEESR
jgi:hypothetical protein